MQQVSSEYHPVLSFDMSNVEERQTFCVSSVAFSRAKQHSFPPLCIRASSSQNTTATSIQWLVLSFLPLPLANNWPAPKLTTKNLILFYIISSWLHLLTTVERITLLHAVSQKVKTVVSPAMREGKQVFCSSERKSVLSFASITSRRRFRIQGQVRSIRGNFNYWWGWESCTLTVHRNFFHLLTDSSFSHHLCLSLFTFLTVRKFISSWLRKPQKEASSLRTLRSQRLKHVFFQKGSVVSLIVAIISNLSQICVLSEIFCIIYFTTCSDLDKDDKQYLQEWGSSRP